MVPFFRRSMYGRKKIYCIDQWFLNGVCVAFRAVVFILFHAATHFGSQFNLTTLFQNFPVMHMKCSCACTIENHNDEKITYHITLLNKDSLFKFMHMAASENETVPCTNHTTAQLIDN